MARFPAAAIAELLARSRQRELDSQERGKVFEDLIAILLQAIPGLKLKKRNYLNSPGSEEIDFLFFNMQSRAGLPFIPFFILVECKNWSSSVGSQDVVAFINKVERRHIDHAMLFAANGVSGSKEDWTRAEDEIRIALIQKGIHLIVIERDDIATTGSSKDFVEMMIDKLCNLKARV